MTDVLTRYNSGKLWDFDGGIHPPEMKSQSNQTPITRAPLAPNFYVPIKQHAGSVGNILVKVGDQVLKGQPLTLGDSLRALPVHAPTSGIVKAIAPYIAAHPSGLSEMAIHIEADGLDQWREQQPAEDFLQFTPDQLIEKIYQAGIAGLGGAVFPTAAKIDSAQNKVKLLIINGAECEPYITCDDRLMRDYADEIIEGCRILRYILRPEKCVIAIEDNKPEAVQALKQSLQGANDIDIRVIPTKYPSGAAKQLIEILTGMEVPSGQRSSSIGVLMQNVGTAFAIKRAIINDEPLIERVVTLTGDKVREKGNQWVRFGTPINFVLENVGYQADARFPVFVGGPMMGLMLPDLRAPITKTANCLLAPDHFEYDPQATEQSCIRCSACSDHCPVHLMPMQMYWHARAEDHEKSKEYNLMDCIECGACQYVCPSHIPLIQYFRQEKAKIWEIADKAKKAEAAKIRFEQRQARLEQEEQARRDRVQRAASARREEVANSQGEDPVAAALARLKARKTGELMETPSTSGVMKITHINTQISDTGTVQPDNSELMAQRKARRLARQQASEATQTENTAQAETLTEKTPPNTTAVDPKKAAIAAALARAKAKKAQQQSETVPVENSTQSAIENTEENSTAVDPKKAAIAAALARAKAKKAQQQSETVPVENSTQSAVEKIDENQTAVDPKKAAIAAALARAKAKKAQQQGETALVENSTQSEVENTDENQTAVDPKKAAIAAAIARAKAKKAQQQGETAPVENSTQSAVENTEENSTEVDPKKAAIAAAIARAKAKKAQQQVETSPVEDSTQSAVEKIDENQTAVDPKKAAIAAAIARAKAKKLAQQNQSATSENKEEK